MDKQQEDMWVKTGAQLAAARVMLAALKTAINYREKGIVLDMMLAAIEQAEEAGLKVEGQ